MLKYIINNALPLYIHKVVKDFRWKPIEYNVRNSFCIIKIWNVYIYRTTFAQGKWTWTLIILTVVVRNTNIGIKMRPNCPNSIYMSIYMASLSFPTRVNSIYHVHAINIITNTCQKYFGVSNNHNNSRVKKYEIKWRMKAHFGV